MRVHIISDMEGVAGIVRPEQTLGGHEMYEEGPQALHGGDQRRRARREGRRSQGDRRDGPPRRRQGVELPTPSCTICSTPPASTSSSPAGRSTRSSRGRLRRVSPRRHARDGRNAGRGHEPHRVRPRVAQPPLQRRPRRRVGHQCCDVRQLGLSGPASSRGTRPLAARPRLLGDRLTTVAVKKGLGCPRRTKPRPCSPGSDRGGRSQRAEGPQRRAVRTTRAPGRDRYRLRRHGRGREYRSCPASRSPARGRSSSVRTDWWTAWRNLFLEPSLP